MDFVVPLLVGSLLEWVVLMVVLPIAQRLADFSMPGLGETAWKLFAIVLAKNLVAIVAAMAVGGLVGSLAGVVVFWIGMVKVFEVDFFGAVVIVIISWAVQFFVVTAVFAAFAVA